MFSSPTRLALLGYTLLGFACGHKEPGAPSDMGIMDASLGLTCGQLLACDLPCKAGDSTCTNNCNAEATAVAQGLFDAFNACISINCSSAADGPCANSSSSACSSCNQAAATGPCVSWLERCEADTSMGSPNFDGGVVNPAVDAGTTYNCGELIACTTACAANDTACVTACNAQATLEASALEAALNSCLAMACPSTPGGPCETPGLACNGCIEQVTLAEPDTCAAPYIACNADTSNLADGGSTPTSLFDGGVLETALTGLKQPASTIVASGGYLYYTEVLTGVPVSRLSLEGASAGTVSTIGPPQPTPVSLAVDANNVYVWSVGTFKLASSVNNKDATAVQIPLNGGPAITLGASFEVFYDSAYLNALAIDSSSVYWVTGGAGNDGTIMKAPIGGGSAAVAIYAGLHVPQGVVSDGTNVYWIELGTFDSMGRSNSDGTVWQGSVNGGPSTQLASNQPGPSSIAFDSSFVYWSNLGPLGGENLPALKAGSVRRTPIGGGPVTTIAANQSVPVCVIVSGNNIYWSEYGLNAPGLVLTAPAGGGPVTPLVAGLNDPAALAVWNNTLYWTDANSSPTAGFIMSLSPF